MASVDLMSMLPLHQHLDSEMDNLFDFNQVTAQPQQQQQLSPADPSVPAQLALVDDFDNNYAGPSHQYDLFRQQTGIPVGDLSHLQMPEPGFDASWQFDMGGMMGVPRMTAIREAEEEQEEEEAPSNVGRLWPGMHQQQAQRAAQAKAQALALRQARAPFQDMSPLDGRPVHPRQPSMAPSLDDDFAGPHGLASRSMHGVKREDDDMDEDERLLASEEGKKLSSKERRQLRNKVSARAFRSRRKEYITQLEGEINVKDQECNRLKTDNATLSSENARYRDLIAFLIKQPAFAPVLAELNRNPGMSGASGLSLLPPTGGHFETSPTDPSMNHFNGMPFNFQ